MFHTKDQGHVSAKLEKPIGFSRRIERGLSDVFGTELHDLPETREEVLTASKALTKDPVLLLGPNATETAFKSEPLADFKIVHIAAHGFVDTQFPERSGLVLGVDPASHDDGLLQVREIIRLHFNADLVTLSACNTGVGKIEGEEGVTKPSRGLSCERSEGGCRKSLERGRYIHRRTYGTLLHPYRGRPTQSLSLAARETGFARKRRRPCSALLLGSFLLWSGREEPRFLWGDDES